MTVWMEGWMAGWRDGGRATLSVAGALPEAVPGMVAGLPRTLAPLPATLSLRHSSVGAAAALVISVVAAAVAAETGGERRRDAWGANGPDGRESSTTRPRGDDNDKPDLETTSDICCISSRQPRAPRATWPACQAVPAARPPPRGPLLSRR